MTTVTLAGEEPFLIDGSWVAPAGRPRFDVVDPASGESLTRAIQASPQDVDAAVAAAAAAHPDGRWRALAPDQRSRVLTRIADLIEARAEELAVLETRDNGK